MCLDPVPDQLMFTNPLFMINKGYEVEPECTAEWEASHIG